MYPSQTIVDKATKSVTTSFSKEVLPLCKINKKSFVVCVVNIRGGQQHIIDYTFNSITGRQQNMKVVESKWI